MKKALVLLTAAALITLSACGGAQGGGTSGNAGNENESAAEAGTESEEAAGNNGEDESAADTDGTGSSGSADAEAETAAEEDPEEASGEEAAAESEEESEIEMPVEVSKDEEVFGVTDETESSQTANPFVDCKTTELAEKLAGFTLQTFEAPEGYEITDNRVIPGQMLEIIYADAGGQEIRLRKGVGTEDISGDYNTYDSEETVTLGDVTVTEKAGADGIHVAYWTKDEYAWSLTSSAGLSAEQLETIIPEIMK